MWPWEAFNWGMFWAILAAAGVILCLRGAVAVVKELCFPAFPDLQTQLEAMPGYKLDRIREKLDSIEDAIRERPSE